MAFPYEVWSGACKVWSGAYEVWSGACKVWSGAYEMWSGLYEGWSGAYELDIIACYAYLGDKWAPPAPFWW